MVVSDREAAWFTATSDPRAANEIMMRKQESDRLRRSHVDDDDRARLLIVGLSERLQLIRRQATAYAERIEMESLLLCSAFDADLGEGCRLSDLKLVHRHVILPSLLAAMAPLQDQVPTLGLIAQVTERVAQAIAHSAPLWLLHDEHVARCTVRSPGNALERLRSTGVGEQAVARLLKTAVLPRWHLLLRDIMNHFSIDAHLRNTSAMRQMTQAAQALEAIHAHLNVELRRRDASASPDPGRISCCVS